jgi:hypothetical protein
VRWFLTISVLDIITFQQKSQFNIVRCPGHTIQFLNYGYPYPIAMAKVYDFNYFISRGKPYKIMVSEDIQFKGILSPYFALTYTLPLKNGSFLAKFSPLQNLKVAIYKGFVILGRRK